MSKPNEVKIRAANPDDFDWINQRYDEVAFLHSLYERDVVMIAEVDGHKAGLGRLVKLTDTAAELGGMYVLDEFRGRGITHHLIDALLNAGSHYATIYCLPFSHLHNLYRQHGFEDSSDLSLVPAELRKKHCWCNTFYEGKTTLLLARVQQWQ